jgi:hypothetical protein
MRRFIDPFYEQYNAIKIRKKKAKEDYVFFDKLPHFKKRLYHSMEWEKYNLR